MATRRRCYRSFFHRRHCARPTRKFLPSTPTSSRAPLFSRDLAVSLSLALTCSRPYHEAWLRSFSPRPRLPSPCGCLGPPFPPRNLSDAMFVRPVARPASAVVVFPFPFFPFFLFPFSFAVALLCMQARHTPSLRLLSFVQGSLSGLASRCVRAVFDIGCALCACTRWHRWDGTLCFFCGRLSWLRWCEVLSTAQQSGVGSSLIKPMC